MPLSKNNDYVTEKMKLPEIVRSFLKNILPGLQDLQFDIFASKHMKNKKQYTSLKTIMLIIPI